MADDWLRQLLVDASDDRDGLALVGVGGYGRRELAPQSDLDVVLVHRGRRDIATVAERLWYPIWDAKIALDHSVRTVRDALNVADGDLKAALGLLDARVIAGDQELGDDLVRRARRQWEARARRWLPALFATADARRRRFGDVAFLLEPELKEGKGGLRDVVMLAAIAAAVTILPDDDLRLDAPRDALFDTRVELHRVTGRSRDALRLEDQDAVAERLGLDADELMAAVAVAGRAIGRAVNDARRRVDAWIAGPKGRGAAGADRVLGPGLVLRDGEVALAADARPAEDPTVLLRAAEASARIGAPLALGSLRALAAGAPVVPDPWPNGAREALIGLLGAGEGAIEVFETLDQHDLVSRILPEWEAVRSRPQRNAFHRFTVDRHLVETAAGAAARTREVARPDLLLVGAWLHDLGKGFPGDHTDAGTELMHTVATRMGFDACDVETLVALVRHHLLLPSVATSRDLSAPATIDSVAEALGDRDTLELLAALTKADSVATGEAAWSPWKERLLDELVDRVSARFQGAPSIPVPALTDVEEAAVAELSARDPVVHAADGRVVVAARDRPGLLSRVVGVLALHGQNVLGARAVSMTGNAAVETFDVEPVFDRPTDWTRFETDLVAALDGRLPIDERLAARARDYAMRPTMRAARRAAPGVLRHEDLPDVGTVVEVRAPDELGLLYRITDAFARLALDIRHAKVVTLGHEAIDTFYLRDVGGPGLADGGRWAEVQRSVLSALDSR